MEAESASVGSIPIHVQLEQLAKNLSTAARTLALQAEKQKLSLSSKNAGDQLGNDVNNVELLNARRDVLSQARGICTLLSTPADFLERLAMNTQLLGCLQWLCESQVLATIPRETSVPFGDIAAITGVPEAHLCRVARTMMTVGFLHEPVPCQVAHTALSASFVIKPSLLDAALFLSDTAVPASLKMVTASKQFADVQDAQHTAFNLAMSTPHSFAKSCEQERRLSRRAQTYFRYCMGDDDAGVREVLGQLDWSSLGNATIVDAGAPTSMVASSLAIDSPQLNIIVQPSEEDPALLMLGQHGRKPSLGACSTVRDNPQHVKQRLSIQPRAMGAVQTIGSASVYILRCPALSPVLDWKTWQQRVHAELRAHINVLRTNAACRLLLVARALPSQADMPNADVEGCARLRDLSLLQLSNSSELDRGTLRAFIHSLRQGSGGSLLLVQEYRSPASPFVAFEMRYEAPTAADVERREVMGGKSRQGSVANGPPFAPPAAQMVGFVR
ncbi:hypothetical protein CB0940_03009 [Cercospora beticola]|uniref:Uncharacterized protein n=1 Tax=Cercospora beticola TaxID=122368 RepID=A0A2G5I4S1_CERBT|nr:hypothetical protein CB0940_03009 [Cercospora beticola]PIA99502.1 hypothetical protein CB0940_03009 [Cercospora beticola]WPB00175.1 hypothetical protein RHO25_004794 [Cercospora beticola]CAK1361635.1 unnamed protein product [Cercospora beticola]